MAIIKIRATRDRGFTIVSNHYILDQSLNAKEKGILTVMLSKPDNWDMSVEGLTCYFSDGTASLRKGIQRLEEMGYLLRLTIRGQQGRFGHSPYVVFEKPLPEQKRCDPDYNPLNDADLDDLYEISDSDRARWLSLVACAATPNVRSSRRACVTAASLRRSSAEAAGDGCSFAQSVPSAENAPVVIPAVENHPQINTVVTSIPDSKKVDINTSFCRADSYPSYPSYPSAPVIAAPAEQPGHKHVDNFVDNSVDNAEAEPKQVPMYDRLTAYVATHELQKHSEERYHKRNSSASYSTGYTASDRFNVCAQRTRAFERRYSRIPKEERSDREAVKQKICYDTLCSEFSRERIDTVVDVMMEVNNCVEGRFRIDGMTLTADSLREYFDRVNQFTVEHMFRNLSNYHKPIQKPKAFFRSSLYNAVISMNEEIREQVKADHPLLFIDSGHTAPAYDESDGLEYDLASPPIPIQPAYACG